MSTRVSPTEQLRAEIDDLFEVSDEQRQLGDTLEEVARLGARSCCRLSSRPRSPSSCAGTATSGARPPRRPGPGGATATGT